MIKRLLLIGALFPVMLIAQPLDKVVAVVNDDVITASELSNQVDMLRKQLQVKQTPMPADEVLRKQVLQHLIDVNLQLQLAKNNGITIDAKELDDAIEKIAESNKLSLTQLREEIVRQGLQWEGYRENIRKEMLLHRIQQKAIGSDIVISSQQVEDYLRTAQQDKTKQQFHLQNIVIPLPEEPTSEQVTKAKAKADALLVKLKQGTDFSSLAIAESSGEYALEGGTWESGIWPSCRMFLQKK